MVILNHDLEQIQVNKNSATLDSCEGTQEPGVNHDQTEQQQQDSEMTFKATEVHGDGNVHEDNTKTWKDLVEAGSVVTNATGNDVIKVTGNFVTNVTGNVVTNATGNLVTNATDDHVQRTMNDQPIDDDSMKAIEGAQKCLVQTRHDYTDLSGRYDPNGENTKQQVTNSSDYNGYFQEYEEKEGDILFGSNQYKEMAEKDLSGSRDHNGENTEQPMTNLQELLAFESTPSDHPHPWKPRSEIVIDREKIKQIAQMVPYLHRGYYPEHEEKEVDKHVQFAFENTAEIEKMPVDPS